MRERPKSALARAAELANGVASTMRRMQREREPRVLLYDHDGLARLLQPEARGQEQALAAARRMVELAGEERRAT
jgi:hypothetical protein